MEGESGDSSKNRDNTEETTVNNFAGTEIKTVSRLAEQADDLAERRRELALQKEQYYARFQGGECSSDEEQDDPNSTDEQEMNDDEKMGVNQYTMLSDEFGDFVSADDANSGEEFADFTSNTVSAMTLGENPSPAVDDGPDVDSEVIQEPAPPAPVVPSIAPFSKDKVDRIKSIMSNITIKRPNAGAVSVADMIVNAQLRVGDEISSK